MSDTAPLHSLQLVGWVELLAKPIFLASTKAMGFATLNPSYGLSP